MREPLQGLCILLPETEARRPRKPYVLVGALALRSRVQVSAHAFRRGP